MQQDQDAFAARLTEDICRCLDQLKSRQRLLLTVHRLDGGTIPCWYRFLPYNTHQSIYCLRIKDSPEAWEHCIQCQGRVLARAQGGPYAGICWAGGLEAVFPLQRMDGTALGFLSVSGYAADEALALPRIQRAAWKYCLSFDRLWDAYRQLRQGPPDMAALDQQTAPLRYMITLLLEHYARLNGGRMDGSVPLYQQALHYMNRNFCEKLTLKSLAEALGCSYSSVSHLFGQYGAESFTQMLARIRVEAAQKYLEYTDESVMAIAASVGFDDPNYFSYVFRRQTGMPPTAWRLARKNGGDGHPI